MADTPNSIDPQLPSGDDGQKPSFLATSTGRIVVIGGALVAVVIIAIVVGLFVMSSGFFGQGDDAPIVQQTPQGGGIASKSASETGAPIVDPAQKPLESTFTFRNVFAPTVKRPTEATLTVGSTDTSSSSSGGSSGGALDLPADTLFLESIQTTDGEKTATLIWNNQRYQVGEGDTIADTPWKVLEINDESVVMLYGDTEVTLTVGQGLSK